MVIAVIWRKPVTLSNGSLDWRAQIGTGHGQVAMTGMIGMLNGKKGSS